MPECQISFSKEQSSCIINFGIKFDTKYILTNYHLIYKIYIYIYTHVWLPMGFTLKWNLIPSTYILTNYHLIYKIYMIYIYIYTFVFLWDLDSSLLDGLPLGCSPPRLFIPLASAPRLSTPSTIHPNSHPLEINWKQIAMVFSTTRYTWVTS